MNEKNFRGIDLNLLVTFATIMRERSITRAGARLFLSQSAISHALRRLRSIFDDPLFARTKEGVTPTPRANALYADLLPHLEGIERMLLAREEFDPASAQRVFRVGLPSSLEVCIVPVLLDKLATLASGIDLVIRPVSFRDGPAMLDAQEIDVAISVFSRTEPWHVRRSLGRRNYLCLYDGRRLGLRSPIKLSTYLALPHLLTSFSGDRTGVVDAALEKRGLKRRVLAATENFASLPFYLLTANAVATLPSYAAKAFARPLRLSVSKPPLPLPDFELTMISHQRLENDRGHAWFRGLLARLVASL
ncbi:MAG TPA: LysR family transcriptional regulator [Polyangiaceae bacterium]|nr:LysR family transcriptional regulator [Polyangiaceae bacterium]